MEQSQPERLSQILNGSKIGEVENEDDLQEKMAAWFSKYFNVEREVWNTTHKYRIDLVIIHKSDLNKKYPIGIEIKLAAKKTGKGLALWLKQASNYADQDFIGYGKCLIATCPQISEMYLREGTSMTNHENSALPQHNNIGTFIGQFNIGEVQKVNQQNCRIVYKGSIIWDSQYNDLRTTNYERLCPRK